MTDASILVKISAKTAAEVCGEFALSEEAQPLLRAGASPLQFLNELVARDEYLPAAVDFLARALPQREAVWWGCLCVWQERGPRLSPPERKALVSAVRWALYPTEPHRRDAGAAISAVDPIWNAIGRLAQAVFESGGSMFPPDQPVVEPGPTAAADGVAHTIHMLALSEPMEQIMASYCRSVGLGIGVALGKHRWPPCYDTHPVRQRYWPGQTE